MIITTIKDGFGNQLFMYACGYAIASRLGQKLILDTSILAATDLRTYELDKLNIKYDYLIRIPDYLPKFIKILIRKFFQLSIRLITKTYNEKISFEFDSELLNLQGSYRLYGYWQSEKYFNLYRSDILKMLSPNYITTCSFNELLSKIRNTNSVSLHVRRGDFVNLGFCLDKNTMKRRYNLF